MLAGVETVSAKGGSGRGCERDISPTAITSSGEGVKRLFFCPAFGKPSVALPLGTAIRYNRNRWDWDKGSGITTDLVLFPILGFAGLIERPMMTIDDGDEEKGEPLQPSQTEHAVGAGRCRRRASSDWRPSLSQPLPSPGQRRIGKPPGSLRIIVHGMF